MLKQFAEWVAAQKKPTNEKIDDKTFIVDKDGSLCPIHLYEEEAYLLFEDRAKRLKANQLYVPIPQPINVSTLTGIADYIKSNPDNYICESRKAIIQINSATEVNLYCQLQLEANDAERALLVKSKAITPHLNLSRQMPIEEFIIMLQSQFSQTEHRDALLKIVSNLEEGENKTLKDNGLTQTVTVKSGVASLANETIPNPACLAPFRTFIEVEQPRSYYVCRLHNGGYVSLTDASGGEWENTAIQNVKKWFEDNLSDEVMKNVFILA